MVSFEVPSVFNGISQEDDVDGSSISILNDAISWWPLRLDGKEKLQEKRAPIRFVEVGVEGFCSSFLVVILGVATAKEIVQGYFGSLMLSYDPKISLRKDGDQSVIVSQFMMEFIGLKTVDGEDPPRILHFNPGLKKDWSGKPVI
ncbi:hypothetical protein Ancab_035837, partial [Ancistrocladus abbreviatus]